MLPSIVFIFLTLDIAIRRDRVVKSPTKSFRINVCGKDVNGLGKGNRESLRGIPLGAGSARSVTCSASDLGALEFFIMRKCEGVCTFLQMAFFLSQCGEKICRGVEISVDRSAIRAHCGIPDIISCQYSEHKHPPLQLHMKYLLTIRVTGGRCTSTPP